MVFSYRLKRRQKVRWELEKLAENIIPAASEVGFWINAAVQDHLTPGLVVCPDYNRDHIISLNGQLVVRSSRWLECVLER